MGRIHTGHAPASDLADIAGRIMKRIAVLMFLCFILVTAGCGMSLSGGGDSSYAVTDDAGRIVTLRHKPVAIVSLTYGTDEILAELVGLKRIRAFSKYAGDENITWITEEQKKEVSHTVDLNMEAIMALRPDLVVASSSVPANVIDTLESMGVPVYVSNTSKNWDDMERKITGIAAACGEEAAGRQMVADMRAKRERIEQRLSVLKPGQKKVVLAMFFRGILGKKGTLFNEILSMAHVINGADRYDLPHGVNAYLSPEIIPEIDPEVILCPVWQTMEGDDTAEFIKQMELNPALQNVRAIKNHKLIPFSERYKYVMSQHITDSIEAIAKAVYPELWEEKSP